MSNYVSRHNPRRQTLLRDRIASPGRYDSYYDLGHELVGARSLPTLRLPIGHLLYRWCERDIEQSRQIPPSGDMSVKNRYSGARLTGTSGQGALYLASLAALLRENTHYAGGTAAKVVTPFGADPVRDAIKAAAKKTGPAGGPAPFHVYRAAASIQLADLRVQTLARLFTQLLTPAGARSRFGFSEQAPIDLLVQAVLDPNDYSAARGLSDAIADAATSIGVAGLCATSARGDSDTGAMLDSHGDGVHGSVYALFGRAAERMLVLEPVASFGTFKDLVEGVKKMPGFVWIAT